MSELFNLKLKVQRELVARGFRLGTTGPNRDGIDGDPGLLTWHAIAAVLCTKAPPTPAAGAIAMVTPALLALAVSKPRSAAELEPWAVAIRKACTKFEIDRIRRVAAFITQMAHESDLTTRSENLNYSVEGLLKTFGRHRISAADAQRYGRKAGQSANQQMIASCIYGGPWGAKNLGNTEPGDGWLFRGTGPLQVTGRDNFTRFAEAMAMPLPAALEYARTLEGGIMAAAWFWESNDINRLADTPGVTDESKAINGGTNGLADRRTRFNRLVDAMLRLERGETL